MDPLTIGASVVTILTPYVADAGKEFVKTAGEAGLQKTKELMQWLKAKFAGDPVATTDLSRFEKDPEKYASGLQETIETKAKEDPGFSAEINQRVQELGPIITVIQQFDKARNLTGVEADQVRSGQVNVTQGGKDADGVKGFVGKIVG
jgi:hypothetical protein